MGLVANVSQRHGLPQSLKLTQLLNRPLVLERVEERDGDNDVFYVLHLSDGAGRRYVTLSGHTNIAPILGNIEEGDLPATVMFEQRGKTFFMVDVEEPIAAVQEELPLSAPPLVPSRASREAIAPRAAGRPAKPLAHPVAYDDEDLPF